MMRFRRGLLGLALVVTLVFAWTPHPPTILPNDKAEHMLAFVTLYGLSIIAYPATRWWKPAILLMAFGAVIELVQGIPAVHRDCDIRDWYADVFAISISSLATLAAQAVRNRLLPATSR